MKAPIDEAELLDSLRAIYRDADALYAGWSCPASSECCHFGLTGREPFVTSIELLAVQRAVARRGGPLGRAKRALPWTGDPERERICPLLDRQGRCSIYADRPLGCRTFHCSRAAAGAIPARGELRALVRRIEELAARHVPGGDEPRTLGRALSEPARR